MAPSPSGNLHIGTAHTTLFNFAFAKRNGGEFILRIDDSDRERAKKEFEDNILESLKWLGISWDEGPDIGGPYAPYRQSQRTNIYQKYVDRLLDSGNAYRCFCTKEELEEKRKAAEAAGSVYRYDGKCRNLNPVEIEERLARKESYTVRFLNPGKKIHFDDLIRGEIIFDTSLFGDFIIVRSNGDPLLNLAVTVDDIEMKITHAIRGEDFISATPYQLLIYEALGETPPKIANFSFIFAPDRTKLSKRHGATSISEFREIGYLPEAIINYLIFLNWNPGDERELMTLDEFIEEFDFARVLKSTPAFNIEKLNWYNEKYIRALDDVTLGNRLVPYSKREEPLIVKAIPLVKERLVVLSDFDELTSFLFETPVIEVGLLKKTGARSAEIIELAIQALNEKWDGKYLEDKARDYCQKNNVKVGDFFMVLRVAVTGRSATPPLWEVMEFIGKEETLTRLEGARTIAS